MAVTIDQVAAVAGCSRQTVSAILNGRSDLYRPETNARVAAAARHLGYRPNSAARAMAQGRFGTVALILSDAGGGRSTLPEHLLAGIAHVLEEHDLHLTVARLPDERLTDARYVPKILREWSADGLLINYNARMPERMGELIETSHLPAVWLNDKRPTNAVYPDDAQGGRLAAETLLAAGHRRIAYTDYTSGHADLADGHYSRADRLAGYEQAMRSAGLEPCLIGTTDQHRPFRERIGEWEAHLSRRDRSTAVVAYSSDKLEPMLYAAERMRLEAPRDLSLVVFGSKPAFARFCLTTVRLPEADVGREGVRMLLERIKRPERDLPARAQKMTEVRGATVGPPRR